MSAEGSWSGLTAFRREAFDRFGAIHDVEIVPESWLGQQVRSASTVLDVGCGVDKPLGRLVDPARQSYLTLDADPAGDFDYAHVSEIPDHVQVDLIVANQVLEHLPTDEALELLEGLRPVLSQTGRFIATVPNAAHPVRQWGDATHVTAWYLHDLYSLFRVAGYEVAALHRYGKRGLPRNPLRRMMVKAIAEEYRIDWMDSVLIVATAP